jgi:hypothetical protein
MPSKREIVEMVLSWLRVFIAAILAQLAAGVYDWKILLNAGAAAVLPLAIRYFDSNDPIYGRGSRP